MYNPLSTIRGKQYKPDARKAEITGFWIGTGLGLAASVAAPFYLGWEIGDYAKNALELEPVLGTAIKIVSGIAVIRLVAPVLGPIFVPAGMVVGTFTGFAFSKAKESLENIVSKS